MTRYPTPYSSPYVFPQIINHALLYLFMTKKENDALVSDARHHFVFLFMNECHLFLETVIVTGDK